MPYFSATNVSVGVIYSLVAFVLGRSPSTFPEDSRDFGHFLGLALAVLQLMISAYCGSLVYVRFFRWAIIPGSSAVKSSLPASRPVGDNPNLRRAVRGEVSTLPPSKSPTPVAETQGESLP
ncbi:hypothetical protein BS50DRAFT_637188 [Corynespora cassiicola Philippines]|uniref:Uncharacterized protein n=1 Tax=Corynespora cassiicola Philippines TaxID=1448308 RepID=A0A2T2NEH0_CORCC|nr:hypothetical protein BS50DRAFT_637188 [Corynespora cassiicola Philippines]